MIPDFVKIQTRAILNAAVAVKQAGKDPRPEIMIPLVGHVNELIATRALLDAEAQAVVAAAGEEIDFKFGTMIEIPRAVLGRGQDRRARRVLQLRHQRPDPDDVRLQPRRRRGRLPAQVRRGRASSPENPFQTLDDVIADEMQMAVDKGRATRPNLKVGICGEHGGDPASIHKCEKIGLNYVSCSPFRVPVARLAAAQAVLATSHDK